MLKNVAIFILCVLVIFLLGIPEYVLRQAAGRYEKTSALTLTTTFPAKGTTLGYEDFRGYKVPIKSDGQGGTYRVVTDVPWDMFTIEEKFDMARVNGGYLNEKDIEEIRQKYTKH